MTISLMSSLSFISDDKKDMFVEAIFVSRDTVESMNGRAFSTACINEVKRRVVFRYYMTMGIVTNMAEYDVFRLMADRAIDAVYDGLSMGFKPVSTQMYKDGNGIRIFLYYIVVSPSR